MNDKFQLLRQDPKGRVAIPVLLWLGGVPIGLVLLIWFIFFRG